MDIHKIKENFDYIRSSPHLWEEFAFEESEHDEQNPSNHSIKRYALAIQLKYHWRPSDEEFVNFLYHQEIKHCRKSPYGGYDSCFMILTDVLTQFRNPENLWLFLEAKFANYDTYFHIDPEHIYSAGYKKTCDYLTRCEEQENYLDHKEYLAEIQERISESSLEKLWDRISYRFEVKKEEDESIHTRFHRAVVFEAPLSEIQDLFRQIERDPDESASSLVLRAIDAKLYDRAVFYQSKIVHQTKSRWDRVSALEKLSKIYCLADDYRNAYSVALRWTEITNRFQAWKRCGLGNYLVERWLLISEGLAEQGYHDLAKKGLRNGQKMLERLATDRKSPKIYELAMQVSEILGLQKRYCHYKSIYQKLMKPIE